MPTDEETEGVWTDKSAHRPTAWTCSNPASQHRKGNTYPLTVHLFNDLACMNTCRMCVCVWLAGEGWWWWGKGGVRVDEDMEIQAVVLISCNLRNLYPLLSLTSLTVLSSSSSSWSTSDEFTLRFCRSHRACHCHWWRVLRSATLTSWHCSRTTVSACSKKSLPRVWYVHAGMPWACE